MRSFTLKELQNITGGRIIGHDEVLVDELIIDSRKPVSPEGSAFLAISGERNDGHDYVRDLYKRKLRTFIIEEGHDYSDLSGANFLVVKDSLQSLRLIAAYVRSEFPGEVVSITGSNGKTIVKEWIFQSLKDRVRITRSPESYNSQVGVPLSLFLMEKSYQMAIIEAGISRPGEMQRLQEMIKPSIGIITNIGAAHQENFHSLKQKALEKLELFRDSKILIYCSDYQVIHEVLRENYPSLKTLSWGRGGSPDYLISTGFGKGNVLVKVSGKCQCQFEVPFTDEASVENAIHVFVYLHYTGYEHSFISAAIKKLEPVAMRMELLKGLNNCTIINDSYNSDLVSVSNAVHFLNQQHQHKKRTVIISDILQSGMPDKDLYAEVARITGRNQIDRVIGIGEKISSRAALFGKNASFYPDTGSFLAEFDLSVFENEAILIKGSRKYRFEMISSALQEKAHRTIMEIDLNALVENYRFYKSLLKPVTRVMAMVKAFSYGSGSYEIANILQYNKVDYLAVAFADEGVALRKNGIETPIMVMNAEANDFPAITAFHLEPEIYNFRILSSFSRYIGRKGLHDYPVHIKIDTGMHRLGFRKEEAETLAEEFSGSPLKVISVFSHLAAADDPAFDVFTRRQISDFNQAADYLQKSLEDDFMKHILNSAGIERFPEAQMDMVRLGIGLYGVSSFVQQELLAVSTFKTRIAQIMELEEGETVGYGRKGRILEKTRVATLPVGYADGLPRLAGNGRISFMLNGKFVPTLGNICMDMCMININGVDAHEGDEVEIFGKKVAVNALADATQTIPYEILTNISERVKRVYYRE